jgi:broad-specificity NMP kinase
LARALSAGTHLLLLDEPLGALDAKLRVILRYELRKLVEDLGLTAIHVTHDQEEALMVSDKIIILRLHPSKLKKILINRDWKKNKINENIEAEILDVILCEALNIHTEENCFEIDGTEQSIKDIANCILELVNNKFKNMKKYKIGKIDWSDEILKGL